MSFPLRATPSFLHPRSRTQVGTIARDNLDLRAQIERLGLQPVMFTAMKCRPESEVKSRAARKQ
eukprot:2389158-Rhodomonas_salina.1